jgi:hypothetical protein
MRRPFRGNVSTRDNHGRGVVSDIFIDQLEYP